MARRLDLFVLDMKKILHLRQGHDVMHNFGKCQTKMIKRQASHHCHFPVARARVWFFRLLYFLGISVVSTTKSAMLIL
jgi:hypothetical protein